VKRCLVLIAAALALGACFDPEPPNAIGIETDTSSGTMAGTDPTLEPDSTGGPADPTMDPTLDPDASTGSTDPTSDPSSGEDSGSADPTLCGNAVLDDEEACDLGEGNNDNGACTTACQLAVCGDGLVEVGAEDCDDGGESATCNVDCTSASCGDGIVNAAAGESCDAEAIDNGSCETCELVCDAGWLDCESGASDGCETHGDIDPANCGDCGNPCDPGETCSGGACLSTRRVFLSSAVVSADFGGVEGADAICADLADTAGLGSNFMAWVSSADQGVSVADRFEPHDGPYVLLDGTPIAADWDDLIDGTLDAPILLDEYGEAPGGFGGGSCHGGATCTQVFTGTTAGGGAYEGQHDDCDGWSTTTYLPAFSGGDATATDQGWSLFAAGLRCDYAARLYCFEQ